MSSLKRPVDDEENNASPHKHPRVSISSNEDELAEHQTASENDLSCVKKESNNVVKSQNITDSKTNFIHLRESDVGIREYISDLPSLSATIKERYSDFLVNEIDLDGKVIHLTSFDIPVEPKIIVETDALTADEMKCIEELQKEGQKNAKVIIDVTDKNKEQRTKIHLLIKNTFSGLDSSTENQGEKKCIVIQKGMGKNRRASRNSECGKYTHFVLYKENRDTMDAVNMIATKLRISPKHFSYAGTKDKRAKTVQCVSAYQIPASRLLSLNKMWKQMKIGDIVYKNIALKLGDLYGNQFIIILRQFKGDVKVLEEAISSLSTRGFLNYYGMQRFGTTSVATHRIGRALLLSKWKEAIDLILKPRDEGEDQDVAEARKTWFETGNARKALEKLRYKSNIEGRLLTGLADRKTNYLQALDYIPRNTRLMYVHSFQSYIWNKVLSRRIKEVGLKIQVGDLIGSESPDVCNSEDADNPVYSKSSKAEPEVLTEDQLNKASIYDVVLPLPGHCIKYPDNIFKTWYEEFLKEDDMDFDSFKLNNKTYSLTGAYRKIVVKPTEVKWELQSYRDNTQPLVLSDWELLNGEKLQSSDVDNAMDDDEIKRAVKLELVLPASSYATMAIREILKLQSVSNVEE